MGLLGSLLAERGIPVSIRAESEALLSRVHAEAGDVEQPASSSLRPSVKVRLLESDEWLARIVFRIGAAYNALGDTADARERLSESAELASRGALWSIASRSFQTLANIALFEDNDSAESLWFAQQAALPRRVPAITPTSVRARSDVEPRNAARQRGPRPANRETTCRTRIAGCNDAKFVFGREPGASPCVDGRYADAHRLFGSIIDRQQYPQVAAMTRGSYALALALDGRFESAALWLCRRSNSSTSTAVGRNLRERWSLISRSRCSCLPNLSRDAYVGGANAQAENAQPTRFRGLYAQSCRAACARSENAVVRAGRSPATYRRCASFRLRWVRAIRRNRSQTSRGTREPPTSVVLTPAEVRVIRDLAAGLTPKQIAADMGRSVYTVQTHIQNVIDKFGCHGRAEAIAAARRSGLLREG